MSLRVIAISRSFLLSAGAFVIVTAALDAQAGARRTDGNVGVERTRRGSGGIGGRARHGAAGHARNPVPKLAAYKAAEAKNQDQVLDAAEKTTACSTCHDPYREKTPRCVP